jgi:hypothetical protein
VGADARRRDARRSQPAFVLDEIHHREIKAGTPQDKTFLVAQDWLRSYFSRFVKGCSFKAFIVDYEGSQHFPFPGETGFPEHLERSTLSAFLGALAWSFPKEEQIRLRFVSDETDNELERQVLRDLPHALATKWNERQMAKVKRGPWMRASEVEFVSSNPKAVDTAHAIHSEFIQLSDVLLGACFDALELVAPPNNNGRRELSKSVLGAIGETIKVPWLQQVPVHRRFSVSLYPDANNFAYPAALRSVRRHCTLSGARLPGF